MSHEKDPELRAIIICSTEHAHFVANPKNLTQKWWLSRSLMGYSRKTVLPSGSTEIVFTLPEWCIEKKQCWELVP